MPYPRVDKHARFWCRDAIVLHFGFFVVAGLTSLVLIKLKGNQLTSFEAGWCTDMTALTTLSLANNPTLVEVSSVRVKTH